MSGDQPLIVACVSPADLRPEVDGLSGAVSVDLRRADLPASEAAAIEYALRIADAWSGRVMIVAAGPADLDGALAPLCALGAQVVRCGPRPQPPGPVSVGAHPLNGTDLAGEPAALAARLAAAILLKGDPAVVVCGDRSADRGVGSVPAFLAHELGLGQALGLVSLEVTGPGHLLAERRLDGGWRERLEITGPAVLSVEAAGVRLRRAGLAAALASTPADVEIVEAESDRKAFLANGSVTAPRPYRPRTRPVDPPVGDARHRLLSLTQALSEREPARIVGPLEPAEAADELLAYLARAGLSVS